MLRNLVFALITFFSISAFADKVTMVCPSISCISCQGKITETLSKMEGVDKKTVLVNLEKKTVTFEIKLGDIKHIEKDKNDLKASFEQKLAKQMSDLGYPIVGDLVWVSDSKK